MHGVAARQDLQALLHIRGNHQQSVIGQRVADGDGAARFHARQAGRHRRLGRPIGVEHLAAGARKALDHGVRAHFAAQVDDAQAVHVLGEQGQQGRHRVQHGDAVLAEQARQRFRVAGGFLGAQPESGADQVGNPDLFEGHVEGDREALVDAVRRAHAQHLIFTAQEMANAALVDQDAFRLAGRARGVDHVGRGAARHLAAALQRVAGRGGQEQVLGHVQRL
jgi:hypothetical protein